MSGPMALSAAKLLCDVYYAALVDFREARGASHTAKVGVVWTLKNRADRGGWWGTDISEVAVKKWQYSSLTDPNDKQLTVWPVPNDPVFRECLGIAYDVLHGDEPHPFPGADSYFDTSIAAPKWTKDARFCGQVDNLLFYDVDHDHEAVAILAAAPATGGTDFEKALRDFLSGPVGTGSNT